MENFVGNHVKFLADWGQLIVGSIGLFCLVLIFFLVRNNRYFLPKGIWGYLGFILLLLILTASTLVFIRISKVKPAVMAIISQLESLKGQSPPLTFNLVSDSAAVDIKAYRGKVVLLNFWATWCKPCLTEIPDLNKLHQKYNDKGLVVIALSDETRARLVKFTEKKPLLMVSGFVTEFEWATMGSERPVTFLINREGEVVDYFTGAYDFEYFESKVSKWL